MVAAKGSISGSPIPNLTIQPGELPFQIDLSGRIHVDWRNFQFRLLALGVKLSPTLPENSPFRLQLQADTNAAIEASIQSPEALWEWQTNDEDMYDPRGNSHLKLSWREWSASKANESLELMQSAGQIESSGELDLKKLSPSGVWRQVLHLGDTEGLWGTRYISIPLLKDEVRVDLTWQATPGEKSPWGIQNIDITGGPREFKHPSLHLAFHPSSHQVSWDIPPTPITSWFQMVREWPELEAVSDIEIRRGTVTTKGSLRLEPETQSIDLQGDLSLKDLAFRAPKYEFLVEGLNLQLPLDPFSYPKKNSKKNKSIRLHSQRIQWRGLRAALDPFQISLLGPDPSVPAKEIALSAPPIPLKIETIPLQLGAIVGRIPHPLAPKEERTETQPAREPWMLFDRITLQNYSLTSAVQPLCLPKRWIPPMKLDIHFSNILTSPSTIDPDGTMRGQVFGGEWTAEHLGIYRFNTPVPEYDFSLQWKEIRLEPLAKWLNFGGIDGKLRGYAHDVVLQGWLPTRYQFDFRILPDQSRRAIFTSRAMQNTVKILLGDASSNLPGIAQWLIFDWPSRILGDYSIHFAGISATSKNGLIELSSHTPDDILKEEKGTHYLLHSSRFKIPIRSEDHPVRIDAVAMSNFLKKVSEQLASLKQDGTSDQERTAASDVPEEKERKSDHDQQQCPIPEFSS